MTTIETRPHSLFVGGEWIASSSGATFEVHDPFSGDAVLTVAAGTREDARRAVEAAASAAPGWAASPPAVRQGIFLRAADILEGRRDEIVDLLARETGSTFGFGMFQMMFTPGPAPAGGRRRPTRPSGRSSRRTSQGRWRWVCGSPSASSGRSRRGTRR